jgi:hypothetical protein
MRALNVPAQEQRFIERDMRDPSAIFSLPCGEQKRQNSSMADERACKTSSNPARTFRRLTIADE